MRALCILDRPCCRGRMRPHLLSNTEVLNRKALVIGISSIIKRRMAAVPVGDALEGIASRHQAGLIEMPANELEGDRTTALREAAW